MATIEGRFVRLRPMEESDAPLIVEWRNHPKVAKWLVQWKPLELDEHLTYFKKSVEAGDSLLIYEDLTGHPVGTGALYLFDRNRKVAEWGRLCGNPSGEQSFGMVEASYLTILYGLEQLGLHRIHAECTEGNKSSCKLLKFLGFQQEGLLREYLATPEGYRNVQVFGLLSPDFEETRQTIGRFLYNS